MDNSVACDGCMRWFHEKCENLTETPSIDDDYICLECKDKNVSKKKNK